MDPDVVNDPRYKSTLIEDLQTLPSISLVLPPDELWAEENGIYSNPTSSGVAWERGGSVELINAAGESEFQIDAGIRVHGGFGRRPAASAKHSFRLFFKGEYGASKLDYPWFTESTVDQFDTIVLRAHYNYSWSRGDRGGVQTGKDYTMVNDRWANVAQQQMGWLSPEGNFAHLYVNGLYWGIYNPTERPDASYQAAHRGGRKEDYDVQNHEGTVDGNRDSWRQLLSAVRENPIDFSQVESILDVDNYIDYMILNQYGGNGDWPQNNWYASRLREDGQQWQFHTWDSEFFFVDPNVDRINSIANSGPGQIFLQLLDSEPFRVRFADRIQKHMFNGGVLTPGNNIVRMDQIAAELDRAIVGESARWGDGWMDQVETARTRDDDWLPRLAELRNDYFPARHNTVIDQYQRADLFPETLAPVLTVFGGTVAPGTEVVLRRPAAQTTGTVFYSVDGDDPRNVDGTVANGAQQGNNVTIAIDQSLTLRARVRNGDEWSPLIEVPFTVTVHGDVTGDSQVDHEDIDQLCQQIASGVYSSSADLNADAQVTLADRDVLITDILGTNLGDVDLDGLFNSSDLITVFQAGEYEDGVAMNSRWSTGDWTCDHEFDSSDMVAAFQRGAYTAAAETHEAVANSSRGNRTGGDRVLTAALAAAMDDWEDVRKRWTAEETQENRKQRTG